MRQLPIDSTHATGEWYAAAINDEGMIGGHVIPVGSDSIPYYWISETSAPLAPDMSTTFPYGEIYGINSAGVMVGIMWNDAQEERAFVFETVNGVRDLNALVDPALGWTLEFRARRQEESAARASPTPWQQKEAGPISPPRRDARSASRNGSHPQG